MQSIRSLGIRHAADENFAVSYTTGHGIGGCALNVHRVHRTHDEHLARRYLYLTQLGPEHLFMVPADHDGRRFDTLNTAEQFALEHGYIREFFSALRETRTREAVA